MKKLKIPYSPQLSGKDLTDLIPVLAENGVSAMVEQVNWPQLFPYKPLTEICLLRSDESLFVRFYVRGNLLKAVYTKDQSPVHEDSCVEFFCQIPGNAYYTNFEFNCIGTCLASRRKGRNDDVQPFSEAEMQTIKRLSSIGRRAFNEMQGNFEWDLTVEIPFALIGIDKNNLPAKLHANFYKCADDTDSPHFVSWNAIATEKPDFHRPEFFGELEF
jgi:hypothetical protein